MSNDNKHVFATDTATSLHVFYGAPSRIRLANTNMVEQHECFEHPRVFAIVLPLNMWCDMFVIH